MEFEAIRKVNVSDEVYDKILQSIIDRKLNPGDKLPSETRLAQMFGVSRVTVRAALQRLAGTGIVESHNGEGTYVKSYQEGILLGQLASKSVLESYDREEILDFRRGLEMVAAELAARKRTEEEVRNLSEIYHKMEAACQNNQIEEYARLDLEFHITIARISKNTFILYAMEQMRPILLHSMTQLNMRFGPGDGLLYHKKIVDAIADGNQAEARERIDLNLMNSRQRTIEMEEKEESGERENS